MSTDFASSRQHQVPSLRTTAHATGRDHRWLALWLLACLLLPLLLGGCWGGGDDATDTPSASAAIGPAGGTLTGPDGVQLVVPAGALASTTTLTITRTQAGAPALPPAVRVAGHMYEFTPHGLQFDRPVTLRLPAAGTSAENSQLVAASPGEDWSAQDARWVDGRVELQRHRLSWFFPASCMLPAGSTDYGYGCFFSSGSGWVSPGTASALTDADGSPSLVEGPLGTTFGLGRRVTQATTLTFSVRYNVVANCVGTAQLRRNGTLLQEVTAPVTNTGTFGNGTVTFAPVSISHADNGLTAFSVYQRCTGPLTGRTFSGGEVVYLNIGVPVPSVTHTVGGSVSGVVGTGLVLRNNGGDDLPISANGSFSFATPVGDGSPYSVSVASQPLNQTCSVAQASGTASAAVTNVAVTCTTVTSRSWQGDDLLVNADAFSPALAVNATGNGMAVWVQDADPSAGNTAYRLFAQALRADGSLGPALQVEDQAGNSSQPRVAVDAAGNALAVWIQFIGSQLSLYASRYNASTGTWSAPQALETDSGAVLSARAAWRPDGTAMVVWSQGSAVHATLWNGSIWSAPVTISGGDNASQPELAVLGDQVMAVWTEYVSGTLHVLGNVYDGSRWGTPAIFSDPANLSGVITSPPRIASDGSDRAVVVWGQQTGLAQPLLAKTYDRSWSGISTLDSGAGGSMFSPAGVAMNASGQATVVWRAGDIGVLTGRSWSPAGGWTAAARVDLDPDISASDRADVAIDAQGNAIALWRANAAEAGDIYANRYTPAGGWGVPQRLDVGSEDTGSDPRIALDAAGNGTAVWKQDTPALRINRYR